MIASVSISLNKRSNRSCSSNSSLNCTDPNLLWAKSKSLAIFLDDEEEHIKLPYTLAVARAVESESSVAHHFKHVSNAFLISGARLQNNFKDAKNVSVRMDGYTSSGKFSIEDSNAYGAESIKPEAPNSPRSHNNIDRALVIDLVVALETTPLCA